MYLRPQMGFIFTKLSPKKMLLIEKKNPKFKPMTINHDDTTVQIYIFCH